MYFWGTYSIYLASNNTPSHQGPVSTRKASAYSGLANSSADTHVSPGNFYFIIMLAVRESHILHVKKTQQKIP